jgi:hypothetical protein
MDQQAKELKQNIAGATVGARRRGNPGDLRVGTSV